MAHGRDYKITTAKREREWDPCSCAALRGVEIEATASDTRRVVVTDGACAALDILPVTSKEHQGALLKAELLRRGFAEQPGGKLLRVETDGVEISVDLSTRKVSIDSKAERVVEVTVKAIGADTTSAETNSVAALERELVKQTSRAEEQLVAEIVERLEEHLPGLQREMDEVVARVVGQSLEAKARSFGEIESVTGDAVEGTLTIKVRV